MTRPPPTSTLFPYTTLFRSAAGNDNGIADFNIGALHRMQRTGQRLNQRRVLHRQRRRHLVVQRSEEHTSELQSRPHLVCRLLLEKKKSSGVDISATATSNTT